MTECRKIDGEKTRQRWQKNGRETSEGRQEDIRKIAKKR